MRSPSLLPSECDRYNSLLLLLRSPSFLSSEGNRHNPVGCVVVKHNAPSYQTSQISDTN
ncbi:hypothetical protein [Nostoc sp.]|uniref:hypothetical protein n=1 Tax=Nostoc sp. TaxID=1180 RepID=UPI002FFC27E2